MFRAFALEAAVHFLSEERIELYLRYSEGVPRLKNVLKPKNTLKGHTWFGLGRCGA